MNRIYDKKIVPNLLLKKIVPNLFDKNSSQPGPSSSSEVSFLASLPDLLPFLSLKMRENLVLEKKLNDFFTANRFKGSKFPSKMSAFVHSSTFAEQRN